MSIRLYQYIFAAYGGRTCRFYPTCSSYAVDSIKKFGVMRGALLGLWRILRCHPFHSGGCDPVPDEFPKPHLCRFSLKPAPKCTKVHTHSERVL